MRLGDRECDVIHACVLELAVCLPLYEGDLFEILQVLDTFHESPPTMRAARRSPSQPCATSEQRLDAFSH